MTIIQFYKKLSRLITDMKDNFYTTEEGYEKLDSLLLLAKKNKLNVIIDRDILDYNKLQNFDDELDSLWIDEQTNISVS